MNAENKKVEKQEFESVVKSVEEVQKFYLILFAYVVMVAYLNWLDYVMMLIRGPIGQLLDLPAV